MHRRLDLRAKFIVLIVSLLVAIFAVITYVLITVNTDTLRTNLLNDSKSFATLATQPIADSYQTYKDSGRIKIEDTIRRYTDSAPNISNVTVVDVNGSVKYSLYPKSAMPISKEQASSFKTLYMHNSNNDLIAIITPYIEDNGAHRFNIVYQISSQDVQASIHKVFWSILFFMILALVISVIFTYILIDKFFIRPVKAVAIQAAAISSGNLDQQIKLDRDDEISDLADSLNAMAQSLKDDIAKLKETDRLKTEFMIIASHNLRTPLSVINGYLEQSEDLKTVDELRKVLDVIAARSKLLSVFAEDVLTISSLEAGRSLSGFADMDLSEFLQAIADEFKPTAEQRDINFSYNINTANARVSISPAHLRSAIWNLLDNSLKFTEKGGSIDFKVRLEHGHAVIEVQDTGIGIAEDEIPKLFTKFHRGTSVLKYDYEGTGIGLYAAKLVVEQHGGHISVVSKLKHGSTFTITLPLSKGEPELPNKVEA